MSAEDPAVAGSENLAAAQALVAELDPEAGAGAAGEEDDRI